MCLPHLRTIVVDRGSVWSYCHGLVEEFNRFGQASRLGSLDSSRLQLLGQAKNRHLVATSVTRLGNFESSWWQIFSQKQPKFKGGRSMATLKDITIY